VIPTHGDTTVSDRGAPPKTAPDADLEHWLLIAFTRDHATEVVVVAEPAVTMQRVLEILNLAKSNGLSRFAIGLDAAHVYTLATPQAQSGSGTMPDELVISIRANGEVVVRGTVISDSSLDGLLQAEASRGPLEVVVLVAGTAQIGELVTVMDRAKRGGLTRFAIGLLAMP